MEWRNDYNIGVEVVDKAHRQLFVIVRRLLFMTPKGRPMLTVDIRSKRD